MRNTGDSIQLSASDLAHFLSCRHLTALDLGAARERYERPGRRENTRLKRFIERGLAHEADYVKRLRESGLDVVELNEFSLAESARAIEATREAMKRGAEIIVQGALAHDAWFGYADILRRVPVRSTLGEWSYEALDTKLAQETRAGTILQLGLYTMLLARVQGETPERFHVVIPGLDSDEPVEVPFRTDDFAAFTRLLQQDMLDGIASGDEAMAVAHYPEPNDFCNLCRWQSRCRRKWRADDHLSLVAGLGRLHRRELEARDFATLAALASMPVPIPFRPNRGSRETYERAREQALVQLNSRGAPVPLHKVRPDEPPPRDGVVPDPRGFARLPEPSPGDLFLDLEGDRASEDGGHEYLFGLTWVEPDGTPGYEAHWAFTRAEEQAAFERVMDRIIERIDRDPGAHVYHYAPYEPSAFKRLMGRYATREDALDRLLREGRFVDLYGVVRQGLWVGVESYSIKRLEPCYGYVRDVNLPDANEAMQAIERALELRSADLIAEDDRDTIEGYNRDDCVSTLRLRDWLERVRAEAIEQGRRFPRFEAPADEKSAELSERDLAVRDLRERLLGAIPVEGDEPDIDDTGTAAGASGAPQAEGDDATDEDSAPPDETEHANGLLAYLLDYHRREDKATWWEYFRLRDLPDEDLLDERAALVGLEFVERVDEGDQTKTGKPKGPVVDRYRYPEQETDIDRGSNLYTSTVRDWGRVVEVDRKERTIDVRKSRPKAEMHPPSVFEFEYVNVDKLQDALFRLGEAVASSGTVEDMPPCAEADLLLRRPPRLRRGQFVQRKDETVTDFAVRTAVNLDHSVLAIQGPPGAGKTYTGAELICELVAKKKRVGVTANSHKVIRNLLDAVLDAAKRRGETVSVGHKDRSSEKEEATAGDVQSFGSNEAAREAISSGGVQVLGGTAWMWAREEFGESVDVLVVDEAGQMALANVLAVAHAAESIVLLGDPQQLDQPVKAHHPKGVAVSALQHILGDHQTIPGDHGIFLPTTWRMSPALTAFTSELFYERRLSPKDGLERQELTGADDLNGSRLHLVDVEHDGNRNHSPEEVAAVGAFVRRLTTTGVKWRGEDGKLRKLTGDDVLVVAPYNTHVNRLTEALEGTGARVGTVDKFQGQEAPVVIYSLATSRPEDAPRGMEFLYNPNRLNVATSRARCAVFMVASPHLFRPECRSVRHMRLANALCRYRELAKLVTA